MANIDFPASPTVGQTYTFAGVTYTFTSQGMWTVAAVPSGGGSVSGGSSVDAMAPQNLLINGGMEISQENGATAVAIGPNGGTKFIVDGWVGASGGNPSAHAVSWAQSTNAPPGIGLNNSAQMIVTAANPSPVATDFHTFFQRMEGLRVARLAWGTSGALPITIGFWVLSAARAGLGSGSIRNPAGDRSYAFTYTINAVNTWEYKTITIPGDVVGTWPKDNTVGIQIFFAMIAGTNFQAPVAGAWQAGNYFSVAGALNFVTSTSDVFRITGITMLPGTMTITPAQSALMIRPFPIELAVCKRYYDKSFTTTVADAVGAGACTLMSGIRAIGSVAFSVEKRAAPTLAVYSPGTLNAGYVWFPGVGDGTLTAMPSVTAKGIGPIFDFQNTNQPVGLTGVFSWIADARM